MARAVRKTAASRKGASRKKNPLKKAASKVKKAVSGAKRKIAKKKIAKKKSSAKAAPPAKAAAARRPAKSTERPARREADIPMASIERTYAPNTSVKAGFRSDGSEQQRDQQLADVADDRWNDEDRVTNKSGDPRIGTHGRTYEPGEKKRKPVDFETE